MLSVMELIYGANQNGPHQTNMPTFHPRLKMQRDTRVISGDRHVFQHTKLGG